MYQMMSLVTYSGNEMVINVSLNDDESDHLTSTKFCPNFVKDLPSF